MMPLLATCLATSSWHFLPEEKVIEYVFRVNKIAVEPMTTSTALLRLALLKSRRRTNLIILSALCSITKTCHRRINFLECIRRSWCRIFIWVHLNSTLFKRSLQLCFCSCFFNAKDFVVILGGNYFPANCFLYGCALSLFFYNWFFGRSWC